MRHHESIFSNLTTKEQTTTRQRENMNGKFDELTKSLAQSTSRRAALKKFGIGLGGMMLAALGLPNKADAGGPKTCLPSGTYGCTKGNECCSRKCVMNYFGFRYCV
jgi:hypothetical protein